MEFFGLKVSHKSGKNASTKKKKKNDSSTTLPAIESSLQRMLFDIIQSPETAFAAPVTDVTLMTLKKGQAVDPQVNVAKSAALPTGAQGVCIEVNLKKFRNCLSL